MAEPTKPTGGRQTIIIATVLAVVFFAVFLIGLRAFSGSPEKTKTKAQAQAQAPQSSHVVIFSNMDLKDSALVITRLKELKIPYQIKDDGRAIAVPRGRADEARLGLAEKNLPAGGSVGWEIFDQAKLGATDFDRRIQFIRAISGELARTINRISSIDDARVQIVIPETKLFEVSKAPVTASVLLKMKLGETLTSRQINGIVKLVAGSVENLKPENITIIDTNGNMLTGGGYTVPQQKEAVQEAKEAPAVREEVAAPKEQEQVVEKAEEKSALEVQAKLDMEEKLTSKVQSLLNKMYPPNITIARVNIDSIKNRKTTVIILADKSYKISRDMKKSTFETVSAAVGYDKGRGDKIIMKSVTFHAAVAALPAQALKEEKESPAMALAKKVYRKFGRQSAFAIIALFLLIIFSISRLFRRKERKEAAPEETAAEEAAAEGELPVVEQIKGLATKDPELAAQLIKSWLAEEGA